MNNYDELQRKYELASEFLPTYENYTNQINEIAVQRQEYITYSEEIANLNVSAFKSSDASIHTEIPFGIVSEAIGRSVEYEVASMYGVDATHSVQNIIPLQKQSYLEAECLNKCESFALENANDVLVAKCAQEILESSSSPDRFSKEIATFELMQKIADEQISTIPHSVATIQAGEFLLKIVPDEKTYTPAIAEVWANNYNYDLTHAASSRELSEANLEALKDGKIPAEVSSAIKDTLEQQIHSNTNEIE